MKRLRGILVGAQPMFLILACLSCLISLIAVADYEDPVMGKSATYAGKATVCLICWSVLLIATISLILAASNPSFSSNRCQLSAVVLFLALVGPLFLAIDVLDYYFAR